MSYEKHIDGSYIHNCYVKKREDDPSERLFTQNPGSVLAHLNGYAIIPLREYEELIGEAVHATEIEKADRDLHDKTIVIQLDKNVESADVELEFMVDDEKQED